MITRRSFFSLSAAFIALLIIGSNAMAQESSPLKGKRVLYVWGGWMGHEPDKCRDIFVPWLESEGATVAVSNTLDSYIKFDLKKDFDLIIQAWTMGTITGPQEKALEEAIKSGVGLAGWHAGTIPSTSSWWEVSGWHIREAS
jgi:type 1 glutamine amidotransferase